MLWILYILFNNTNIVSIPNFESSTEDYRPRIIDNSPFSDYHEGWHNGNYFNNSVLWRPMVDMEDAVVYDKVWWMCSPQELVLDHLPYAEVFNKIFYSNAVRRLQAVEQLTLPPEYSTIPNTAGFSRFEHIWGSVLFVRQIGEKHGIKDRQLAVMMLRTLVSDIAHTIGSHLGDWAFQGVGGKENLHDDELRSYLEATDVANILQEGGFSLDEVVFPPIQDFVEAASPNLNTDRVDYGLREMNRWNRVVQIQGFNVEDFVLTPENMLAMTDQRRARIFSEGYLQLALQNWSEPTHRFMTDMLLIRTKLFYAEGSAPDMWVFEQTNPALINLFAVHPRDLMYVTDLAQLASYEIPSLAGQTIEEIMKSVARYHRQRVWPGKEERLDRFMWQFVDDYDAVQERGYLPFDDPCFNDYKSEYPPTLPLGFAILSKEEAERTYSDTCIDFPQPPLKMRVIDPLVQKGDTFVRLSDCDIDYARRLQDYKRELAEPRVARMAIPDRETKVMLTKIFDNVERDWQKRLRTSRRLSAQELNSLVGVSASQVIGRYPFLDFVDLGRFRYS